MGRVLPTAFALALVGIQGLNDRILSPDAEAAVLRALTARLTRALRGEDWLARGKDGDFVVLVDGSIADAETVAARLVAAVGPLAVTGGTLPLSAVAGVTALLPDVDTGEALRRGDRVVTGGGISGQAGALSMALARSLAELEPESRSTLKKAGLLTRDARKKESKKYGLKKARKAPQYSKR